MSMTSVDKLIVHPNNPRVGNVDLIAESIENNGWFGTVVAQRSTGYVLAGNHRLMAAKTLGMTEVPVYWVDVDDATATRILLADNRTTELGFYDNDRLVSVLQSTDGDLIGTGWSSDDVDALLAITSDDDLNDLLDSLDRPTEQDEMQRVVLILKPETAEALQAELARLGSHELAVENWLNL